MRNLIKFTMISLLGTLVVLLAFLLPNLRERFPEKKDQSFTARGLLTAGFAKSTLELPPFEPFTDQNQNGSYDEGEPFEDTNQNGSLDGLHLAGFAKNRFATEVKEPLEVQAFSLTIKDKTLVIVSADVIGLFRDEQKRLEIALGEEAPDQLILTATHTHSAPDVIGLWGSHLFHSGVHPLFLAELRKKLLETIKAAMAQERPAKLALAQINTKPYQLQEDVRPPQVIPPMLTTLLVDDKESGKPLGTLLHWALHPEVYERLNTAISSDFVHYLRKGVESGVLDQKGRGGVSLFLNGAIGGLLTLSDTFPIQSLVDGQTYLHPSKDKVKALGESLALLALRAAKAARPLNSPKLQVSTKTIELPLTNKGFKLLMAAKVLDRGLTHFYQAILSDLTLIRIGPLALLTIPGELYPEVFHGGVEFPEEGDYKAPLKPNHVPLEKLMAGDPALLVGLAGGFLGYFIPKSQWDVEAPYTYGRKKPPYGEVVSIGPDAALVYEDAARQMIDKQKASSPPSEGAQ